MRITKKSTAGEGGGGGTVFPALPLIKLLPPPLLYSKHYHYHYYHRYPRDSALVYRQRKLKDTALRLGLFFAATTLVSTLVGWHFKGK